MTAIGLALGIPFVALMGRGVSPVTILGSSLIAWWTADRADLITLNGAAVTSWRDVVASYDATQSTSAARPTYSATSFNGSPGLTFDGTDDTLASSNAGLLAALPDGAEACEIWCIAQQDAPASDAMRRHAVAWGAGANTARRLDVNVITGVNRGEMRIGSGAAATDVVNTAVDLSSRHVMRGQVGATSSGVSIDGNTLVTGAVVPATTNTLMRIGCSDAGSGFWKGQVRDVVITSALSAAQVTALQAWASPRREL